MLTLVKTVGGSNGSPEKCSTCGSSHFIKAGIAWNCSHCGLYAPKNLNQKYSISELQKHLEELQNARLELKNQLDELERLILE